MLIDLHVHTMQGGPDSSLTPQQIIEEAKRIGLDGVCVTEHNCLWDTHEFEKLAQKNGLRVFRAMEINTEVGHIAVFGLKSYIGGIHKADRLRTEVLAAGGFMIALHPFRRLFDQKLFLPLDPPAEPPTAEAASKWPVFDLVDEIEVLNGACTERENLFTYEVAQIRGWKGTAGSDAHSTQGLGCHITVFEGSIETERDLLEELRAGRFYPATGLLKGNIVPFRDGLVPEADGWIE